MHHLLWPVCALALMTAACDNAGTVRITSTTSGKDEAGVLKVVDALQCPQTQGVLTRKGSARADGNTCVYSGPRGSEVTLHLVSLNGGSVHDALKGFEDRLSADLPEALAEARANEDRARAEAARAEADAARAEAEAERAGADAERAAAKAEAQRGSLDDGQGLSQYQRNAYARCSVFKTEVDQQACMARVKDGAVSGSVKDGGILREVTVEEIIR